jgi:rubrerythrin
MSEDSLLAAVRKGLKGELDSLTVYMDAAEGAEEDVAVSSASAGTRKSSTIIGCCILPAAVRREDPQREPGGGRVRHGGPEPLSRRNSSSAWARASTRDRVAAAVLLEVEAIRHYRRTAEETAVPALKDFFLVLAEWEERHYKDLLAVQDESERYWFDAQRFEPF